jgi:hypothetical protein
MKRISEVLFEKDQLRGTGQSVVEQKRFVILR